ncbi:hypothetical protein PFISCL1PPCAC_17413, partial [Pristionchus fissidentatus]
DDDEDDEEKMGEEEEEEVVDDREDKGEEEEEQREGIKFDYASIGAMLFDVGKREAVKTKRRAKLYELAKKFELASRGEDPFTAPEATKQEPISGRAFHNAVQKAMSQELKARKGKAAGKATRRALRKRPAEEDFSNGMAGLLDLDSFRPSEKKFKGEGAVDKQASGGKGGKGGNTQVSSGGAVNKKKRAAGLASGSDKASANRAGGAGGGRRKVSKRPKTKSGKAKGGH